MSETILSTRVAIDERVHGSASIQMTAVRESVRTATFIQSMQHATKAQLEKEGAGIKRYIIVPRDWASKIAPRYCITLSLLETLNSWLAERNAAEAYIYLGETVWC
ncbi:hypothetical protein ST37_10090 [Vibrio sp. qd031]|uniref:hypothetical protein n=1 Tax=Vibrio sp. qd031 TaxID=1603038 RepID=UPI000A117B28|nr:hypothetical protein [Vibrio sp. qd031]ORT50236.1 hypothetical protein ST37_10090 [Vibrio sp. qd031]